ncbi:hypothetical protein SCA6_006737 [Theobroma cacao]
MDCHKGLEDPYGEELKRRTEGMAGNEEALFGFMRDLGGQWCSRRRKRRIVNASILGDALPVGWKLLLGLKRREGRASSWWTGGIVQKEDDRRRSDEHEKEVNLLGIDNLAEVFHEHRQYNGHVGIHVRNYVRGIEDSPGLLTLPRRTEVATRQESAPRISKMDALIEIEQNSILETTTTVPRYELNDGLSPDKLNAASNPEIPASTSDHEMNSDSPLSESGTEDDMTYRSVNKDLCQQNSEPMILNEKTED